MTRAQRGGVTAADAGGEGALATGSLGGSSAMVAGGETQWGVVGVAVYNPPVAANFSFPPLLCALPSLCTSLEMTKYPLVNCTTDCLELKVLIYMTIALTAQ